MTVLARDAVASDHLVYAWPFPIGPECEVACAEDEQVVMCPAWLVGDRLGPGRHRWRTPDPSRPVGAFFVLTAPVEVSFDMVTGFMIPATGQPVRVRASGSLQVRCADPGLLIAQFVGLPFDRINDGVLRSVSRSVERMLARLLTRRVVMAGTPFAVTEPSMLPGVVEELVAYNPTAGAVFGVELIRMGHLVIVADDGSTPYLELPAGNQTWQQPNGHAQRSANQPTTPPPIAARQGGGPRYQRPVTPVLETIRGMPAVEAPPDEVSETNLPSQGNPVGAVSGEIGGARSSSPAIQGNPVGAVSGEIVPRGSSAGITPPQAAPVAAPTGNPVGAVSGEIGGARASAPAIAPSPSTPPTPAPTGNPVGAVSGEIGSRRSSPVMATQPMPVLQATPDATPAPANTPALKPTATPTPPTGNPVGAVSGEIGGAKSSPRTKATLPPPIPSLPKKLPSIVTPAPAAAVEATPAIAPGQRVLVPGPNGLMQSATVRQLLQGYYELEVGSSGETIWVPIAGVIPEQV